MENNVIRVICGKIRIAEGQQRFQFRPLILANLYPVPRVIQLYLVIRKEIRVLARIRAIRRKVRFKYQSK
jgi:hypothetical protein